MGYLLTEIVVYLVIAGLIGFAFGWLVRDGALDKYFDKAIGFIKNIWASIIGFFGKIKSYLSNLNIFKKSSETKETLKSDTEDNEKVSLLNKTKEALKAYYLTLTTSKKVVKDTNEEIKETVEVKENVKEVASENIADIVEKEIKTEVAIKEEVIEKTVAEVNKEVEVPTLEETVEAVNDSSKPILHTEAPEEGQDKLSSIKGIGPVLEKKLNELGVYSFKQIASWDSEQELWIGTQMAFPKRVTKEEWVKQAKELLANK